jgi:hypothetical protein
VTQYLFFLDATADSGGNSLLWTSNGASATKTSVSFNPYAGNNLIVLPAIAPVNKPLSRHGIDAGILLVGNDSAGSDNLFFWDGISAPTEVSGGSNAPSNGLIPQCLTAYSGAVYFNAQTNSGNDLWSSDGTTANTNLLTTSNYIIRFIWRRLSGSCSSMAMATFIPAGPMASSAIPSPPVSIPIVSPPWRSAARLIISALFLTR